MMISVEQFSIDSNIDKLVDGSFQNTIPSLIFMAHFTRFLEFYFAFYGCRCAIVSICSIAIDLPMLIQISTFIPTHNLHQMKTIRMELSVNTVICKLSV